MHGLLNELAQTPLPTIFVVAGIGFWILALAGSVAGKITVEPGKQKTAGIVGTTLIALGLALSFSDGPFGKGKEEAKSTKTIHSPFARETTKLSTTKSLASTLGDQAATSPSERKTGSHPIHISEEVSLRPSPGVNCAGTPDEIEICRNPKLRNLDWELYGIFQARLKGLDTYKKRKLMREESAWVTERGQCMSDEKCLIATYKSRIGEIQSAR